MLKIDDNIIRVHGFVEAMHGMRQPYKGTDNGDSRYNNRFEEVGPKDLELAKQLALAGPTHAKYRRMIQVWVDITAPLYWWKEFDTYKVGTVANSESTMHTIAAREFTLDDFSCKNLMMVEDIVDLYNEPIKDDDPLVLIGTDNYLSPWGLLRETINMLNKCRKLYLDTKEKAYWWQMIQLLPSSYNQTRTVMLNYEVLSHIYDDRRNHKLDEWHTFCDWIEKLPYAAEMIFPETNERPWKEFVAVGDAIQRGIANTLYKKLSMAPSMIAQVMDIPESVVRSLIKEEEE